MKNTSIGLELTEEKILFFRMPDEALEIVAGAAKQMTNFSIGYCSALLSAMADQSATTLSELILDKPGLTVRCEYAATVC